MSAARAVFLDLSCVCRWFAALHKGIGMTHSPTSLPPLAVGETEASRLTGISISSFQKMRCTGEGPPYAKVGNRVRYRVTDLDAYLAARVVNSTSSKPLAA